MTHHSFIPRRSARARAALAATALTLAAACGRQDARPDDALKSDLSLTNRPAAGQQVVSPQELTPGAAPAVAAPAPATAAAPAPAPVVDTVTRVVYRDRPAEQSTHHTTRHHASSGGSSEGSYSSGSSGSAATVAEQPAVRHNHTKEGALIGGAAGAVLGAATGGNLKGGVIGAVLGAGAGAVIGNNTGVTHSRP